MAERKTHPWPNRTQRNPNRLGSQRNHNAPHLRLPLPFPDPHAPLHILFLCGFLRIRIFFVHVPALVDPFAVLLHVLIGLGLGREVQEQRGESHGEGASERERRQDSFGEVHERAEEEGSGIQSVERS
ncbi:hypothetical protein HN51_040669 [Arachis hypogaea]|nr:uncharacterized protein DS421_16g545700 [Arachis hypogaea]